MKKLILMRHAEAINANLELDDFNRPLSDYGTRQVEAIKNDFIKTAINPQLVLVSNSVRTKRTAEILTAGIIEAAKIQYLQNLYLCAYEGLLKIIAGTDEHVNDLMIIAHNPSLHELAHHLVNHNDEMIDGFPTSSIAIFDLNINDWQQIMQTQPRLSNFITAKNP
jgi:phosphohistidine phosphatase